MSEMATHYDLVVIVAASFAIQLGVLGYAIHTSWVAARELGRQVTEAQRLTRAVAGLVVQETEKIRSLFPDAS